MRLPYTEGMLVVFRGLVEIKLLFLWIHILLGFSDADIEVKTDENRLRPIDADYQMFDNTKIRSRIDWKPEIPARQMFLDLLNHWRDEISKGKVPLNR